MDTILNLGLNDQTVQGLIDQSGNPRFAYDCYRRFVQMYGDIVLGLKPESKTEIDPFEAIIERKNRLLADKATPYSDLKQLVKDLKKDSEFGIALKVLKRMQERAETDDDRLWVRQQQALCTYKDEEAHPSICLPEALKILQEIGLEDAAQSDPETLALGGAVYKRLWKYRGRMEGIHAALHLYQRAWECDRDSGLKKVGYGGVNAAFILDLLAAKAQRALRAAMPLVAVGTKDVIPVGAVKEYIRSAKEQSGITWKDLSKATGIAPREFYPTNSAGKVGFGRNTLNRLNAYFDDPEIKRLAESDIYWDRVACIEYVGEKRTYDLEIAETHNFIANDILVHNSHAADYGVISVETAFLKTHYTAEYMTALLSAFAGQTERVALYVADARSMGVPVLAPDINASRWDFDIEDLDGKPNIRFGLGAIKNAGQAAVDLIVRERDANGQFTDLNDFARRVDLRAVGKRVLECLIKVGAMDSFGNRAALLASLDRIIAISSNHFRAAEAGQLSLFGGSTGVTEAFHLPDVNNVDRREMLNREREHHPVYSRLSPRGASGQRLILTNAPFASKGLVMSRKVPGPHIAFYVPTAKWTEAIEHLAKLGIENGDRGAAKEPSADRGGTYMDDPAGYVIQFITDGME